VDLRPVRTVVVDTASGKVRGAALEGCYAFKGIAYGDSTGGRHRFQPPRPIAWAGVRDALTLGPRAPQIDTPDPGPHRRWLEDGTPCSEDCLVLNVFTPAVDAGSRRPVMVFLHGGGFEVWSGGAPGIDGGNLARRGVVLVTLNHRLNLFGHLDLSQADGGRYADSANAGLLDCVAALEWVRLNIERFGGDPGNVTLFGQSGGGSKVAALMAMPRASGLFHRAIIQSASSLLRPVTPEQAARNTHHFLAQLGLDASRLQTLHELPVSTLLAAMSATVKATARRDFRPVVDGQTIACQPFAPTAVKLSARVPLLIGWCENEQRWSFASTPSIYAMDAARARAAVARAVGIAPAAADELFQAYQRGRPGDSPGDLFAQILGDHRYRRSVTLTAELQCAGAAAPVYMYLLRWQSPAMGGLLRCPHTLCIAFAFANVDLATGIAGDGDERFALQEAMAGAWTAFAHSSRPDHPGLPTWRPFDARTRATMVFDRESALVDDPLREERLAFEPLPRYEPAVGEVLSNW
jgi:para-nitrobenzyl esterase